MEYLMRYEVLKEAGFNNPDLLLADETLLKMSLDELQLIAVTEAAKLLGWLPSETTLLTRGEGVLDDSEFRKALRRIKSGIRILSSRVRQALTEGRVIVVSGNDLLAEAFPGIVVTNNEEIIRELEAKQANGVTPMILFGNETRKSVFTRFFTKQKKLKELSEAGFEMVTWEYNSFLAAKEAEIDAERLAIALGGVANGSKVEVKYGSVVMTFDFAGGTLDDGLRTRKVKPTLVATQFAEMVDIPTFFALRAVDLGRISTQKSAEAILLASGPSHFVTDDGGYAFMPDDRAGYAYYETLVNEAGIVRLKAKSPFGLRVAMDDTHTSTDMVVALEILGNQGRHVAMKAQGAGVLVDNGALTRHHALVAGEVLIGTDAGKPGKLFNRGKLASRACAETVDAYGRSTMVRNGVAILGVDGQPIFDYGTPVDDVMVTNSSWGPSSGVATVPETFRKRVRLIKTVRGTIPAVKVDGLPKNVNKVKKAEALRAAVLADLVVADEVEHNQVVFSYQGLPYGVFRGHGMTGRVVGKPTVRVAASSETVAVSVKVEVMFWYTCHKVSMQGLKATLIAKDLRMTDSKTGKAVKQPNLLVGTEERKGNIDLVYYWANSVVSTLALSLSKGWITPEDHARGYVLWDVTKGLTTEQEAAKDKYEQDNLSYVDIVWDNLNDAHLSLARSIIDAATNGVGDMTGEEFCKKNGYVCNIEIAGDSVIERNVSAIRYHRAVVGIELSTVLENMGKSGLTGEQILHLDNLSSKLGASLWDEAQPRHDAVENMLDSALGIMPENVVEIAIDEPVLTHDTTKGARELLEYYAKKYKGGISFTKDGKVILDVQFDTFVNLGALLDGGSCTGIALELIRFLDWIHVDNGGASGYESMAARYAGIVREGIRSWASSAKRLLGFVTRGHQGAVLTAKVKCTHSGTINNGEVGVNPNHPAVAGWLRRAEKMGYDIPDDLEGFVLPQFAIYERTPMTRFAGGYIKLTNEAELGVFLICGFEWARATEGDGDGDPSLILVLSKPEIIHEVEMKLLSSPFGTLGYDISHGSEFALQPYAEFFLGNAKKDLSKPENRKHVMATMPIDKYVVAADREVRHYTGFMGTTYAISSYLTYLSGKAKNVGHLGGDELDALYKANVIAESRIYEGLALSGVSDDGDDAANDIRDIVYGNMIEVKMETRARLVASGAYLDTDFTSEVIKGRTYHFIVGVAAVQLMFEKLGCVDRAVAFWLHRAILVTGMYSILERRAGGFDSFENETSFVSPKQAVDEAYPHLANDEIIEDAVVFGMIRRGSQGVSMNRGASEAGRGLFRHVTEAHLVNLGDGIVADTAAKVMRVQLKLNALKDQIAQEDEANMFSF